MYFILGKK